MPFVFMRLRFKGTIQGCRDTLEYLVSSFWVNSLFLEAFSFFVYSTLFVYQQGGKREKTSGDVRLDISDSPDKRSLHY